ncbi:MAG TPA: cyclic nucleotide-binding domain-containing protein, partial [Anaerolineae bacterium]|nr:cyclic nucleotide-binding domain-containing protein [Anaerolineae bacterium]
ADGERLVVARMGRGQYFGEVELLRGGVNMATIRADLESGVEVVALDREVFGGVMAGSQPAREALEQMAQARIAENANGRNGTNHA